jgi:hypothetical protein
VRIGRPFCRGRVLVVGPPGSEPVPVLAFGAGDATLRVFVAAATAAVHVELEPGGRFPFAPVPAAVVVD